jgi:hypothetical protein
VSETKRTPDEPGRGSVATGQHPAEPTGSSNGAGDSSGNGHVVDAPTEEAPVTVDDAPTEAAPVTVDDTPTEAAPVTTNGAPATESPSRSDGPGVSGSDIVGSGSSAPSTDGGLPAADEAATTRFRVPTSDGDAVPSAPAAVTSGPAPAVAEAPAASPEAARPVSASAPPPPPTLDPLPAPAVPAPGPGAAQPPPWRRVPGHDGDRPEAPAPTVADGLLDDGPTAFLEAPRAAPPARGMPGESAATDSGRWTRATRTRPPRQAALQLKRLDPWSVLKLALVLAVVLFFIWLVAVGVLYGALDGMGVWDRLNGTYADLVSGEAQTGSTLISAGRVFGLAAVIGAINSLLFAVAVTVGAFVYNVSSDLVGGIEVTLSERD